MTEQAKALDIKTKGTPTTGEQIELKVISAVSEPPKESSTTSTTTTTSGSFPTDIAAMDQWSKGLQELLCASLYEIGMKGTEAPFDAINRHLYNGYMRGVGLSVKAAFKDWQGKDGTQLAAVAADMINKSSTKYLSFVGNMKGLHSDNPEVRNASIAGLNTFMGDPERVKNIASINATYATYMQGLLGKLQAQTAMLSTLSGSVNGIAEPRETLEGMAAAMNSLKDVTSSDPAKQKNIDDAKDVLAQEMSNRVNTFTLN